MQETGAEAETHYDFEEDDMAQRAEVSFERGGGGVHTVGERRTEMRRCAYLAAAALGAVAFLAAHDWATAWRGCEAVGGEFLLLLAPLWAWMVEMLVTDWREGR